MSTDAFQIYLASGSLWVLLLAIGLGVAIAWWTYPSALGSVTKAMTYALRAARAVGLSLLIVALFEPVAQFLRSDVMQPAVIVAIDESASMRIVDQSGGSRKAQRDSVVSVLASRAPSTWKFVAFGTDVRELQEDELQKIADSASRTSIANVLQWIGYQPKQTEPAAVIIVSDGNDNGEQSPLSAVRAYPCGLYSIGIGDTVSPEDVLLEQVQVPPMAINGEQSTVQVRVASKGTKSSQVTVDLYEESTRVSTTSIDIASNQSTSISLPWLPRTSGDRKLTVKVRSAAQEYTVANNDATEYVRVRDRKRRVCLIAGAPSPDVAYLRSVLSSDPNNDVQVFVQRLGSEFYDRLPTVKDVSEADLCVLVGFPTRETPSAVVDAVAAGAKAGTSVLYVPSAAVDYRKVSSLYDVLPFTVTATSQAEYRATPDVREESTADPLLRLTGGVGDAELWNALPPLYRTETFVRPRPGAQVLATVRVNNAPLSEPLIIKWQEGKQRSLALLGYGLHRWELLREGPIETRGEQPLEIAKLFVGNASQWLAVTDDDQNVRIRPSRTVYAVGDQIAFNGSVLDESQQPLNDAEVTVSIQGVSLNRTAVLQSIGNGTYRTTVGALPPGDYGFLGRAVSNGRPLGEVRGRFTVLNVSVEAMAITQNRELLRSLAQETGGVAGTVTQADSVIAAVLRDPRLRDRTVHQDRSVTLWHTPWPLVGALLAFSLEWFLRKRRRMA